MEIVEEAHIYSREEEISENIKLWFYKALYKKSSKDLEMIWQIGYDSSKKEVITLHGYTKNPDNIQLEKYSIKLNKSNRTYHEQSLLEIRHKYDKKVEQQNYSPDKNYIAKLLAPMSSYPYSKHKDKIKYPVMVSSKLDGIRCLARLEKGVIKYRSRQNKEWSWSDKQYELSSDLKILLELLPEGTEVDGELYSHKLTFEELTSVIKKEKTFDIKDWKKIKFFIFDIVSDGDFETRYDKLKKLFEHYDEYENNNKLCLVKNKLIRNEEELQEEFSDSISNGFEGLMIRMLYSSDKTKTGLERSSYVHKRSVNVLKLKAEEDDEGTVISVYEGKGREKGLALFELKMSNGNVFKIRPKGSAELRAKWYEDREKLIGKKVTYVYQELSSDGTPKFASMKGFRDYE